MHMHDKLPWLYSVAHYLVVVHTPNANPNPTTIYHCSTQTQLQRLHSSLFP